MNDELYFLDIYAGILRMSDAFEKESKNAKLSYDFSSPKLAKLRQKYSLDKIAGAGTDFEKATNLLFWLKNNIIHKPDFDNRIHCDSLSLLEYSFKKGKEHGINCRALSVILTECLLALGIYARTIYMMPFSPYDTDNHVVTHAYIKEINKWVMLDPTFNCYATDENNNPFDLIEIRELIKDRKQIYFNKEINYNGRKKLEYGKLKMDIESWYTEYLSKNLFYFETCPKSCYGIDELSKGALCVVLPKGYDIKKSKLCKLEYLISECKDENNLIGLTAQYDKIKSGETPLRRRLRISPQTFLSVEQMNKNR